MLQCVARQDRQYSPSSHHPLHNLDYFMLSSPLPPPLKATRCHGSADLGVSRSVTLCVCVTGDQNPLILCHTHSAQPVLHPSQTHTYREKGQSKGNPRLSSQPSLSLSLPVQGQSQPSLLRLISESVAGSGQLRTLWPPTLAEVGYIVKILEVVLLLAIEGAALAGRREGGSLSCELHVKVADIFLSSDGRDERRRDLPLKKGLPVHILKRHSHLVSHQDALQQHWDLKLDTHPEERLFFDIFSIFFSRAQTSFRIPSQQLATKQKHKVTTLHHLRRILCDNWA